MTNNKSVKVGKYNALLINCQTGEPILPTRTIRANQYLIFGSRAPVKLVHGWRFIIIAGGTAAPARPRLCTYAVGCRLTRLRLMGALSLTRRKPRGRSGQHSTAGLEASMILTRLLCTCVGPCPHGPGGGRPALHARFPSVPTLGFYNR